MDKVLSIVIPSYNVERFLRQTLDSFQTESILPEIEVLIIDDGSSDNTAAIGKEYETKHPDSFRVISKENGGHGSTINRGIEECQGRYFKVVDGDDWVNTPDLIKLVENLRECHADYVVTNYCEVDDRTGKENPVELTGLKELPYYSETEGKTGEIPFSEIVGKAQIPMHALVIRSEILKREHIRLDEHRFYVDVEYILYPVPFVKTVVYYDLCVYMYRLAQTTQSVSMQGYQKHIQDHIDVIMHLAEFADGYAKQADGESEKVLYINRRIAEMVGEQISIFMSYPADDKEIKKRFIGFERSLKEKNPEIYRLSGDESGTLRLLRVTRFAGYKTIMRMGQKRNHIEGMEQKR